MAVLCVTQVAPVLTTCLFACDKEADAPSLRLAADKSWRRTGFGEWQFMALNCQENEELWITRLAAYFFATSCIV